MASTTTNAKTRYRRHTADKRPMAPDSLVGSYFHTFTGTGEGEERILRYQGQVVAEPHPGVYLVEFYDAFMGEPSNQGLYAIEAMLEPREWQFYDTAEWMREAHDRMTP